MEIKAKLNYLHVAPRKVRLVSNLIKGMDVKEAEMQLKFMPKRIAAYLLKLLGSATANAEKNFKTDKDVLYIKQIMVNEGTPFKRWRPVSRGRAFQVLKRTSSVEMVLELKEGVDTGKIKEKKAEIVAEKKLKEVKKEAVNESFEKTKTKAPKEIKKMSKFKGLTSKIFRRKSF